MKPLWSILVAAPLLAQQPATSPVPSTESWLTGFVELGYRWRTDVAGSANAYRSIVNLGSGPKLLGSEFTVTDPKHRLFDRVDVRAYNWGDDPYSTFHLDARKEKLYDFNADYRNIAYFDNLPSFADPLLSRGIVLNEQSFDTHRRFTSSHLDLLPGHWFVPYLSYDRDSSHGSGVTTFVGDGNEYPIPNRLRDLTNLYRAGVRFEFKRFHATLEQGGTTFKDDQQTYYTPATPNFGNVATPILGQTLSLNNLLQAYGIRGSSIYSKAIFTASALSWLDLSGQFLYSQPSSDVNYQQYDSGNLLLVSQALFFNSQQYLVSATAKLPHTTGSIGAEIRPLARLRILATWMTDRLHNSGAAAESQVLSTSSLSQRTSDVLASTLYTNYSQLETDVFFDLTPRFILRGGYRYVWGDAADVVSPAAGLAGATRGKMRRNVGIGGVTYRPTQKLSVNGDVEGSSTAGAYFRTSLYDYQKIRARARYQVLNSLNISADFMLLNNQNPTPSSRYDYLAHQLSASIQWLPAASKRWDLQGSYERSTLRSNINYLVPQLLQPAVSLYRENGHAVTALLSANLPPVSGYAAKVSAGGSVFLSSGSRPTAYYQPIVKISMPLRSKLAWFGEWRYYGFGESFYLYEGFRTHLLTTGLRFSR